MRFCEICREPSVRSGVSANGDQQPTTSHYCYIHAVRKGLLGAPLALLTGVAGNTGYSANAVIFVLEALSRDGCVAETHKDRPIWAIPSPPKAARKFCVSVRLWGIEQFQMQEHLVLNHWKLIRGEDIGLLLSRLVKAGILAMEQGQTSDLLSDLLALKNELLDKEFRMV